MERRTVDIDDVPFLCYLVGGAIMGGMFSLLIHLSSVVTQLTRIAVALEGLKCSP